MLAYQIFPRCISSAVGSRAVPGDLTAAVEAAGQGLQKLSDGAALAYLCMLLACLSARQH